MIQFKGLCARATLSFEMMGGFFLWCWRLIHVLYLRDCHQQVGHACQVHSSDRDLKRIKYKPLTAWGTKYRSKELDLRSKDDTFNLGWIVLQARDSPLGKKLTQSHMLFSFKIPRIQTKGMPKGSTCFKSRGIFRGF